MRDLAELRREIDEIDGELVGLLKRRLAVVDEIAAAKRASGTPVGDSGREDAILARVAAQAGAEYADDARQLFAAMFSIARARQRRAMA